ncbi:hypothetical protein FB446DRAFT_792574 [Lentinula raphanica]|nr:hypothetical protein FB446DRAFT_792574 [Lentinula raphanica]
MTLEWTEDITLQVPRQLTNGHRVQHLALSSDARYIAIGYDKGVDGIHSDTLRQMVPKPSYLDSYTCTREKSGAHDAATMAAVISESLIAIAYSQSIEIRRLFSSAPKPKKWQAIGELPSPPALNGQNHGSYYVKSVHSLQLDRLVVSYTGPGIMNTLVVCWRINVKKPWLSEIQAVNDLAGIVADVSSTLNSVLMVDAAFGAYRLYEVGSAVSKRNFVPRALDSGNISVAQPVSDAQFLDIDTVVGTGLGQISLWKEDTTVLQNLIFRNYTNHRIQSISSAYDDLQDVGWIGALIDHADRVDIVLWRTVHLETSESRSYYHKQMKLGS